MLKFSEFIRLNYFLLYDKAIVLSYQHRLNGISGKSITLIDYSNLSIDLLKL